jgi:hypothetical protein
MANMHSHGGGLMNKKRAKRSLARFIMLACAVVAIAQGVAQTPDSATAAAAPPASSLSSSAAVPSDGPLQITGLESPAGQPVNGKDETGHDVQGHVELGSKLWVLLNRAPPKPADQYVLLLNGVEVKDSGPAIDATEQANGHPVAPALVFKLKRGKNDDAFWKDLLGSPSGSHVPVTVSLGELGEPGKSNQTRIVGADSTKATFQFEVFTALRLSLATIAILSTFSLVWGHARSRTTLRDNLLPQLEVSRQPYSLGRWQMAFWFTLIFAAFIFLLFLLKDTNTITAQALLLMGISGVTAAASVAVDVAKDSPADATNRGLRALGLYTFEDVQRVRQEIIDRQQELDSLHSPPVTTSTPIHSGKRTAANARHAVALSPAEQRRMRLQIEIKDRNSILRTYEDKTRPFVSQGWFKDITTDLNGTAVHRLQVVCWTITLGVVFVVGVYRQLSMPQFDGMLLALMGISSAGYVGFKVQEVNS